MLKEREDSLERCILKTNRMDKESEPMCCCESQVGTHSSNLTQTFFRLISVETAQQTKCRMGGRYRFSSSFPKHLRWVQVRGGGQNKLSPRN